MEKEFVLKYGDGQKRFALPGERVSVLDANPGSFLKDPASALLESLAHPIGTPPLADVVHAGERVAILVSDVTRLWTRTSDFLPAVIGELNRAGIPDRDISICVAGGTHRLSSADEQRKIVGDKVYDRVSVFNHDTHDLLNFTGVGTTSRGTPVFVNKRVRDHDRIIMTGGIVHHAMAGYGGGRKSVLPGIASRETVKANHLWVLDPERVGIRPGVGAARTAGNPLHEDMVEAADLAAPDFIVNVVTDADGRLAGFFSGHWLKAWEAGCRMVDEMYCVPLNEGADMVVASCGGYPRDISVYQASKSFYNAWMALKPGGTLVLLMEAREGGGGEEFFDWFKYPDVETCYRALKADFTIAGYMAFLVFLIATMMRVILVTDLAPDLVAKMHMTLAPSIDEAVKMGLSWAGRDARVLVMPEAGITLPVCR